MIPLGLLFAIVFVVLKYFSFVISIPQDYQNVLDLMQDIILATDLAHHLRIINELKQMASGESDLLSS